MASHGGTAAPGAQVHSPDTRPSAELGLRSSHTPGSQGHVWEASGLEFSAHVILGLNRIKGGFAFVGRQDADPTESRAASAFLPSHLMDNKGNLRHRSTPRREVFGPDATKARRSVRAAEHTASGSRGNVPGRSRGVPAAGAGGGGSHAHHHGAGRGIQNGASVCTSPTST